MEERKVEEIETFHSTIGFDLSEKESHLDLLVSREEKKHFRWLCRTIPNVTNLDILTLVNIASLMAQLKRLNELVNQCNENIELYLKLISRRSDTAVKLDKLLSSYGLTPTTKARATIVYKHEGEEYYGENC